MEQQFLDASQAHADADLRDARARVRRTRRLAAGLAGVLVLALIATGLAVGYQRDANARARLADANRLAALSTTEGPLDVSLLLAAQAVRLAETPETQDGLLAALIEHRRAIRVAPLGGQLIDATLADNGGTLFATIRGAAPKVVAWPVGATTDAQTVVGDPGPLGWPDDIDGSPTEDLVAAAYYSRRAAARGPRRRRQRAAASSRARTSRGEDFGGGCRWTSRSPRTATPAGRAGPTAPMRGPRAWLGA